MKACDGFILRNIVGEYMLVPTGSRMKSFNGTLMMNEMSAFVWNHIQSPISREKILEAVLDIYDIDEQTASEDIGQLLDKFVELGIAEE